MTNVLTVTDHFDRMATEVKTEGGTFYGIVTYEGSGYCHIVKRDKDRLLHICVDSESVTVLDTEPMRNTLQGLFEQLYYWSTW